MPWVYFNSGARLSESTPEYYPVFWLSSLPESFTIVWIGLFVVKHQCMYEYIL